MPITIESDTDSSKSYTRWLMLGMLWLLYFSFGITVGSIPPLVGPILEDLELSSGAMGLVLGSWQLVYIGTATPLGVLVDRLGARLSLALGVFVILVSLVTRGLAFDFMTLFLSVALFGIGGPIISIGAPKLVSLWFEGKQRSIAAGIYSTGPPVGATLALATASSVVMPLTGTWRGISLVYGAIVLIILVAWWFLAIDYPITHRDQVSRRATDGVSSYSVIKDLLRIRNVQIGLLLGFGTFLLGHGLNSWTPTLLQERGMTIQQAGFWTAVATGTSVVGLLVIPGIAGHGRRARLMTVLLLISTSTVASLVLFKGLPLIIDLTLATVARNSMSPIVPLILMETKGVGTMRMGAATGLYFAVSEIGGFGGPFLLGILRDVNGSLTSGILVLAAVTMVLTVSALFIREGHQDSELE